MSVVIARRELLELIKTVCEEQNLQNYKISNLFSNDKGEGYLGEIFFVQISNGGKTVLELAIKAAFQSEKVRKGVPIQACFQNEISFYTKIYPKLKSIGAKNVDFVPQCFKACDKKEMICLENLKTMNFTVFDKYRILDDKHLSFIFKTYGEFHALSFAWREKRAQEYAAIEEQLVFKNFIELADEGLATYIKDTSDIMAKFLTDSEILQKFSKYSRENILGTLENLVSEKPNNSVVLHGDCWSNNMMFKYQDEEILEMRLLDFQLTFIGSPVCDLSYCLYSGGSKEHFDKLDTYLQIYYDSLTKTLNSFQLNTDKIYSYQNLKDDWKRYAKFGLIMAFIIIRAKCTSHEEIITFIDIYEKNKKAFGPCDIKQFEPRINELLQHALEINTL